MALGSTQPLTEMSMRSFTHVVLLADDTSVLIGTTVAQWLRCCATNLKVAGSIPDGVIGIFH